MSRPDMTRQPDVIDADFISIGPADVAPPVDAPAIDRPLPRPALTAPAAGGMDMLSGAAQPAQVRSAGGPVFWATGVSLALTMFWISGGHVLVSATGPTAGAASPATDTLRIASIVSRVDRSGAKPVLLVDGKAVNEGAKAVAMPPLQIHVVSPAGDSTLYKLGTAGQSLGRGAIFDFSSRLDLPKDGVRTVFVTFAD